MTQYIGKIVAVAPDTLKHGQHQLESRPFSTKVAAQDWLYVELSAYIKSKVRIDFALSGVKPFPDAPLPV